MISTSSAFLIGPTASGKSALALAVCERFGAEILSLDSMQVYRRMDIGTAKPGTDVRRRVPHHLIDLVEPSERYDVQSYLADFRAAEADCAARGVRALVVGGTGLYLQACLRGLFDGPPPDPELRERLKERARAEGTEALHASLAAVDPAGAERIHPRDEKRVVRALEVWQQTRRPISAWQEQWSAARGESAPIVGLSLPVPALDRRIRARTRAMLAAGWVEEARAIRSSPGFGPTASQALGYREALALGDGECTAAEAEERIHLRTRQLARRQRTWFRRFEASWLDSGEADPEASGPERVGALLGWS